MRDVATGLVCLGFQRAELPPAHGHQPWGSSQLRAPILWTLLSIPCLSSEAPSRSAPQPAGSRGGFIAGAQLQPTPGGNSP